MVLLFLLNTNYTNYTNFMVKGKPRHNPDKPANNRGKHCPEYETMGDKCWCVAHPEIDGKKLKCGGNRHNCVKVDYQKQAILKEL